MDTFVIRAAVKEDIEELWKMIEELAVYEKMPGSSQNDPAGLERDGFCENPLFSCAIAEKIQDSAGILVGYVIYYPMYTPRIGRTMYLQDLYVRENYRRKGLGKKLFAKVVQDASDNKCYRVDWRVLLWNDARKMYEKLGGVNITEKYGWQSYELTTEMIEKMSSKAQFDKGID